MVHIRRKRVGLWIAGVALVGVSCGQAVKVDVVAPYRGTIEESFTEPARTRLANTYPVTMPIDGRIGRIKLEPGDRVTAGETLVPFDREPFEKAVNEAQAAVAELEARMALQSDNSVEKVNRAESVSTSQAARHAIDVAEAQVLAGKAQLDRSKKELARVKTLADHAAASPSDLDDAELGVKTAAADLERFEAAREEARASLDAARLRTTSIDRQLARKQLEREVLVHQIEQARTRLRLAQHDLELAEIRAPIDGTVLKRYEQGDSTIPAGQPLLLIGNLDELEVIADVLTQDALKLRPGSTVIMEPATGLKPIEGLVKRIEPDGFTKLSSLGVEQQRVNVIVKITKTVPGLGVGYRLQARFITGSKDDALLVPRFSVLQNPDRSFYVLKVTDGSISTQPVHIGLRSDLEMEIVDGIEQTDFIVAVPDTTMNDGTKIVAVKKKKPATSSHQENVAGT